MHIARGQAPREDVHGARRIDCARREDVHQKKLPFRNRMHRNVAIVVQQRRGQPARFAVAHGRETRDVHPRGAGGGDDQSADEGAVGQLICRHAVEISDDVLILARQASGQRRRREVMTPLGIGGKAKLDRGRNPGKRAGKPSR